MMVSIGRQITVGRSNLCTKLTNLTCLASDQFERTANLCQLDAQVYILDNTKGIEMLLIGTFTLPQNKIILQM